jgi:hypothetical protein
MDEDRWKEICSVAGMAHAKIIEGRLEAEGIPATLKYEAAGVIYAITIDGLGEVKILVPEEDWERAKAVLAQTFEENDLDWERPAD